MKNHISIILAILFLVVGCRSKKEVVQEKERVQIDTVFVETKTTDTLKITETREITKPIFFETEIPCDENQSGSVGSGTNVFDYTIKDGKVQFDFKTDTTECITRNEYRSKWKSDSISIRKQLKKEFSSQEKIKVYVYPWWVWALGIGCVLFAALWIKDKFFSLL